MQPKHNFFEQPVNNRWGIRKKLKSGGFGQVYLARDLKNQKNQYAIKLIPEQARKYADIQDKMYGLIQKEHFTTGFIKYYETGYFMKHRYLLMELIGSDLDDLKDRFEKESLSIKSVIMIGLQVTDRLEALHKIGYLHRDVKPDNLAIGQAEKNKIIYLFDFGLALPIGAGVPKEEKGKVVGTLGFMSCRSHQGKPQGPADDLECMLYTLLYLAEGSLPWVKLKIQSPTDFHKIFLAKKGLTKKQFKNQSIPQELFDLITKLQTMKSTDKVDYLKIKYKLLEALKSRNQENDFVFDWCTESTKKESPRSPPRNKDKKGKYSPQDPNKRQRLSPEDSARKKKVEQKMREQNQQIIQNDILEVYRFMEKEKKEEGPKGGEVPARPKKQIIQKKSPPKVEKNRMKARPASAVPKVKPKAEEETINPWEKILKFEQNNNAYIPKIVINKTAKHKI